MRCVPPVAEVVEEVPMGGDEVTARAKPGRDVVELAVHEVEARGDDGALPPHRLREGADPRGEAVGAEQPDPGVGVVRGDDDERPGDERSLRRRSGARWERAAEDGDGDQRREASRATSD
jgi:hypothetical protein